ncbi:MAG: hypothetical protein Q4C47_07260, partial [Planctomycetia bacterium]|nr:hypothetical protein [Planctomycetia bacterium]
RRLGWSASRFSFNVKGGRCEVCRGQGTCRIEMGFLPDVFVTCPACHGHRFNSQTLGVRFRGRSIADVLEMSIEEASQLFENIPSVSRILGTLCEVGLGYLTLGQSALTLSGGESQRVRLATELAKYGAGGLAANGTVWGRTLYVLDEPTTGLHRDDVRRLVRLLQRLVDAGNTVIVIEHHPDVLCAADWLIDLGPEGGAQGGELVACGTPEEIARNPASITGRFLSSELRHRSSVVDPPIVSGGHDDGTG